MTTDQRVDDYIATAADFARPILEHLRAVAHRALPDVEEGIKWGMPHFMVGGKNVAGMSAFKAHCAFVVHGDGRQGSKAGEALGQYGKIASISDLPPEEELAGRLHEARDRVLAQGSAAKRPTPAKPKPVIPVPADFAAALARSAMAEAFFNALAPSHRRDYLEWITEAKREDTRTRRIATAIEWLAEGKRRNWKYEKC